MFTFYSSCKTNVYSILQKWYLGIMYKLWSETNMILFNIKQCRWRGRNLNSVLSHCWALRTDTEWRRRCAYTHKKQCVRILKTWHNATRRGAALLVRCATPFRGAQFSPGFLKSFPGGPICCRVYLQPWSNSPPCDFLMILKTLISMLRCVWLGLELNSAGVGQIWGCLV